jgi:hypothetical protein
MLKTLRLNPDQVNLLKGVLEDATRRAAEWDLQQLLLDVAKQLDQRPLEVNLQLVIDAGLNAFGLELWCESIGKLYKDSEPDPSLDIQLSHRGLRYRVLVEVERDTMSG